MILAVTSTVILAVTAALTVGSLRRVRLSAFSRVTMPIRFLIAGCLVAATPVQAADWRGPSVYGAFGQVLPTPGTARPCRNGLRAWIGPMHPPTNGPDDPTYVGSASGLGRPSYHGNTPPPGFDDPFERRQVACR